MKGNFFTKNIGLKVASLLLAVILWFFVILSGRSEITLNAPVIFTNLPATLEIVDFPDKVTVTIEGQKRIIKNLKQEEVSAVIDLEKAKEGRSFYPLSKNNFKLPQTLAITSINPETVNLKIETQMKKTVPIKPYAFGLPEKGHVIVEMNVIPKSVEIEGPQSVIKKIRSIKTEPVDISGINNNIRYKANLDLSKTNIKASVSKVEVIISVRKIK